MSRKTRRSRRGPVLVIVTLLLAVGALALWTRSGEPAPAAAGTSPTSTATPSAVPSEPAVPEPAPTPDAGAAEEEAGNEAADPTAQPVPSESPEDDEPAGQPGGLRRVAVLLSYTGFDPEGRAVVAGGYADGVVEIDATCTLILRRNGVELRGESLGTPNVATTDCGEVRVGGADLTSGTWQAVLGYTSDTSVGESAAGEVVVP